MPYELEKQSPSDHIKNVHHYLRLAPFLVPADAALYASCLRHPDLAGRNIRVSTDSGGVQIVAVLDWRHAVVLSLFVCSGIPKLIANEEDEASQQIARLSYGTTSTSYRKKTGSRNRSSTGVGSFAIGTW